MKSIEFEAVISGDGESFCFDVTEGIYEYLKGEPLKDDERDWNKSGFNPGLYQVYPSDIFSILTCEHKKLRIKIEFEEVEAKK